MQVKVKINFSFAKLSSALPRIIEKTMSRYARSSAKGAKKNIDKGQIQCYHFHRQFLDIGSVLHSIHNILPIEDTQWNLNLNIQHEDQY